MLKEARFINDPINGFVYSSYVIGSLYIEIKPVDDIGICIQIWDNLNNIKLEEITRTFNELLKPKDGTVLE